MDMNVDAGFLPAQSVGRITAFPEALVVKEKFFSFTGNDFDVVDHTGAVRFIVKGKMMTMRDKMVITDAAGNKVAVMQKKILAIRETFQIYTYKPNVEGQESTETDEGMPVFRFAMVEKQLLGFTPEFCWKLYKGNDDLETVLLAKVEMSIGGMTQYKMNIKVPGDGNPILGSVGQSSMIQLIDMNTYILQVVKGMDLLGMVHNTITPPSSSKRAIPPLILKTEKTPDDLM